MLQDRRCGLESAASRAPRPVALPRPKPQGYALRCASGGIIQSPETISHPAAVPIRRRLDVARPRLIRYAAAMSISVNLDGHCVLVVGASSGLGREIGLAAAGAGARVAFAARRLDRLESAVRQAGGHALAVRCDVRSRADCQLAVATTVAALGRLDALVFATGMSPLIMLDQAAEEDWRGVLETNTVGASLITAAALPHLRAHGGRAIYLSSYSVRQSLAGLGLYRVSKVALDALIECWRHEHADVAFTRVVVGNTIGTEFADGWDPQRADAAFRDWTRNSSLPKTLMTADQVAEAVLAVIAARGYLDDIAIVPPPKPSPAT